MTKSDRAKMQDRLVKLLAASVPKVLQVSDVVDFVAREVDRAVRVERKRWQADEYQRLERLRQIDEKLVDGLKRIGAPKI